MKKSYIVDSTMKVEYITTSKAAKKVIWLQNFLLGLRVVPLAVSPLVMFFYNSRMVAQCKKPRNHWKTH